MKSLFFLFFICMVLNSFKGSSQTSFNYCVGSTYYFSVQGYFDRITWRTDAGAYITGTDGTSLNSGQSYDGHKYNVVLITFNSEGTYVQGESFDLLWGNFVYNDNLTNWDLYTPTVNKPVITFNGFNGCSRNVSVPSQTGVSFNWSNGSTGTNATYSGNWAYPASVTATSICNQSSNSDLLTLQSAPNTLTVTGSSSFCKSYQTFSASTCSSVNSSGWSRNVSPSSGVSSLTSSNQSATGCDRLFQFTQSGYYTIYCSNGSLNGQFQVYVNNCFQGGTYGLQVSNDGKKVKGKNLDNTIIGSENPDIVLNNPNSNVTVLSSTFIYPNPSNEEFTISGLEGIDEVRFINVQGQVLQTHKITNGDSQQNLKVAQYPKGLYFVQLKNTTGETRIEKVQVNH